MSFKVDWNANKDMVHPNERAELAKKLASGEYVAPGLFGSVTLNSDKTVKFTQSGNLLGMWSEMTATDAQRAKKAEAARAKAADAARVAAEAAAKAQQDYTRAMAEMDLE